VLGHLDGSAQRITRDHKINDEEELKRIKKDAVIINRRLNGVLAITRALGDFDHKTSVFINYYYYYYLLLLLINIIIIYYFKGLSAEPDYFQVKVNLEKHSLLIIASDGLWDVIND
jgi:protein phosphatase 1A